MINPPCHLEGIRAKFLLFLGSSAVERSAVNRLVAGSNPARGVFYATVKTEDAYEMPIPSGIFYVL